MDHIARQEVGKQLGAAIEGLQKLPLTESITALGRCQQIDFSFKLENPVKLEPAVYHQMANDLTNFSFELEARVGSETASALRGVADLFRLQMTQQNQDTQQGVQREPDTHGLQNIQADAVSPKPKRVLRRNLGAIVGEAFSPPVQGKRGE